MNIVWSAKLWLKREHGIIPCYKDWEMGCLRELWEATAKGRCSNGTHLVLLREFSWRKGEKGSRVLREENHLDSESCSIESTVWTEAKKAQWKRKGSLNFSSRSWGGSKVPVVGSWGQKMEASSRTPQRRLMNSDSQKGRRRKLKAIEVVWMRMRLTGSGILTLGPHLAVLFENLVQPW